MTRAISSILLLVASNAFMTLAWYGHLKFKGMKGFESLGLFAVILISWGIAFFEYTLQVPANRIGFQYYDLGQLKIIQEVVTMIIFILFVVLYMKQPIKMDFLWSALCVVGAVYLVFRGGLAGTH